MIVLRKDLQVFQPKLSIESCIILEKLYGSITAPIEKTMPSLSEQVFLLSLCLRQYNLTEDQIYELFDEVDEPYMLIFDLYTEAGLINQEQNSESVNEEQTTDKQEEQEPQTFEEMCNDMLVQCLAIGLSRQEFYQSTLKEITQCVDAYKTQQQNQLEEQAYFSWQTANLIGISVARLLSKEAKYPKLEEAYPFINGTEDSKKVDEHGMTAEEAQTNAMILEWCMLMQERQEKKKAKEKLNESVSSE